MAYSLAHTSTDQGSSSNSQKRDKNIWKLIWNANVPSKVMIFGWRLALGNLARKRNKWKRTLEHDNIYNICGNGVEDSYHAIVTYTKSRALRAKIRGEWYLLAEEKFCFSRLLAAKSAGYDHFRAVEYGPDAFLASLTLANNIVDGEG